MKLYDTFTFGKFKGYTLKYVMANKGSYVGWCLENIPNFHIEPKNMEEQFLKGYKQWKLDGCKEFELRYCRPSVKSKEIPYESDLSYQVD